MVMDEFQQNTHFYILDIHHVPFFMLSENYLSLYPSILITDYI